MTNRKTPHGRESIFRVVGGTDAGEGDAAIATARRLMKVNEATPQTFVDWRTREGVKQSIAKHEAARDAYGKAMAWAVAAEAQNLPMAQIEQAKQDSCKRYQEMNEEARDMLVCMPTDPRALVDLLMYLEKHFTTLPQEVNGRSLAFFMLSTVRLSLRAVAKYGNYSGSRED